MKLTTVTLATALGLTSSALDGGDQKEFDRLGIYASILGRAAACDIDTANDEERVTRWIDRNAADHRERAVRRILFALGLEQHAASQRSGYSIESCTEIRSRYHALDLP